jgi:hypothetical protein
VAHTRTPWARRGHTLGKTSVFFAGNEIRDLCMMLPYLPVRGRCASNNEKRRRMMRWVGLDWVGMGWGLEVGWGGVEVLTPRRNQSSQNLRFWQYLSGKISPLNFPEITCGIIAELSSFGRLSTNYFDPTASMVRAPRQIEYVGRDAKTTIREQNRAQCEIRSSYDRLPLKSSASCHISHLNFLVVKVTMRSRRP